MQLRNFGSDHAGKKGGAAGATLAAHHRRAHPHNLPQPPETHCVVVVAVVVDVDVDVDVAIKAEFVVIDQPDQSMQILTLLRPVIHRTVYGAHDGKRLPAQVCTHGVLW